MVISESGLRFSFPEDTKAVKFDDTPFYRNKYAKMYESKGIDILADAPGSIQLIEIKNCSGHEADNRWRIAANDRQNSAENSRHSLDIELAQKVISTLSCLYGAWTQSETTEKSGELRPFFPALNADAIPGNKKKILVILVLEGDFGSQSRSKKTIMSALQDSLRAKLSPWLHCRVSVVDSDTYPQDLFHMEQIVLPLQTSD